MNDLSEALRQRILDLLAGGRKIEAIKAYREATGLGLAESKAAVEALERTLPPPAPGVVETTRGCASALAFGIVGLALALFST